MLVVTYLILTFITIKLSYNETDTYEFRITSTNGNYWQSREECLNMGGDLLMHNFAEEGSKYFKFIYCSFKNLFIYSIFV